MTLVSYKPNTAFYEAYGIKGWMSLQKRFSTSTKITLKSSRLRMLKGDIGNTIYVCKAFFEDLNFDSITVAHGEDSVEFFSIRK
jgi:orotidine-5'-phosphate decarboxylase